jgi:hypothetical protein
MRSARPVAAIAFLLGLAALAPPASARTPHNPCYWQAGNHVRGDVVHLGAAAMARKTDHYRACGPYFHIPRSHTHWAQAETPTCLHYFKVGGTSPGHHNSHTAHWDYYTYLGDQILWNGFGTWLHNPHDGNAVRFVPSLHNFNWNAEWGVQIWMICERTHMPPDAAR